ncbi:50S ribosomal protein L21 [Actibacterium lipolyticum]|uniref:Large ribosomal subunit protein bL21 n=1 Tax=Actibacterium lipolyticum TaxID=1524263 RepID=A0A238JYQ8_9RHOB|nr:50S ribosomal protein L21 [Actibacterium lipolyticum]SMX35254.1 50S ribosomal protein L21 [Actibacterium lipolyticum]
MFAVLKTGGKQYKVQSGDVLRVEKLAAEAGETIQFNEILMVGGQVGTPTVDGAGVQAEVIEQIKGPKTINFVKRRRKHGSQRTKGHRQQLTLLRVTDILEKGADKSGVKAAVGAGSVAAIAAAAPAAKAAPKKAAPKKAAAKAEAPAAAASEGGTKPANLLTEARGGKADDLKKISGVGPKLEGLLHENGVFHFDQVAAWTADEIAYMDDKLSFKGRIERDNWLEQAAKFAAEQE